MLLYISPRKILGLAEGGILVISKRLGAFVKRERLVYLNKTAISWVIKWILLGLLIKLGIPWYRIRRRKSNHFPSNNINFKYLQPTLSKIGYKILAFSVEDREGVIQKRRENYNIILRGLVGTI